MSTTTQNQPTAKMSIATIAIMNITAVVSLRFLPSEAEYGLGSIFFFAFAAIVFLIPMALVAAELATMGATLANAGINPVSKERVLSADNTPRILADMTMEGLYDTSGDWAYTVGLPGKSGVGGGILAVVPGVMGIAAFSPPLDEVGNSVRGQKMVASVANTLGYNLYKS